MTELHNDVVTLVDEEGLEHQFMLLDIIMVNDKEYAIMIASEEVEANADEDEQEAVIFRIDEAEDGEQTLIVVEEDAEWDAVAAAWEEQADLEDDEEEEEE